MDEQDVTPTAEDLAADLRECLVWVRRAEVAFKEHTFPGGAVSLLAEFWGAGLRFWPAAIRRALAAEAEAKALREKVRHLKQRLADEEHADWEVTAVYHENGRLREEVKKLREELARVKADGGVFLAGAEKDDHWNHCPTFYDGCHCTVEALAHNIARADKAEAELKKLRKEVLGDQ